MPISFQQEVFSSQLKGWCAMQPQPTWLDLYNYRKITAAMYRTSHDRLRRGEDPAVVWQSFRSLKDALFRQHPQSPLAPDERTAFAGLRYFPYDPSWRVVATLTPDSDATEADLPASNPHAMRFRHAARARFSHAGTDFDLYVYWIDVYGGSLFLPFRDASSASETYGGGRYLFDTTKGSDFEALDGGSVGGYAGGRIMLDFNYAYNPSCAYDSRWVCPLAPPENRLTADIRAGELRYHDDEP
jgi:uncharacterized protein